MKKFYILLIALLALNGARAQSCLPEGITFTTQTQIDNFQTNYPNCTEIEGDVIIQGEFNITNLDGLSVVTSIGGDLDISNNLVLTSLTGLENVTSIGGDLWIYFNTPLTSLTGLDNIDAGSITNLYIFGNDNLSACEVQSVCEYLANPNGTVDIFNNAIGCNNPPEVAGGCGISLPCLPFGNYHFITQSDIDNFQTNYPDCTEIKGSVRIDDNGENDITNLNGLSVMVSIGGDLRISYKVWLTSLTGLDNITSIGGILDIHSNEALISLAGLEGLNSIGGSLSVSSNNTLNNLTGLDNVTSIGGDLHIGGPYSGGNPVLTSLTGLDNLTSIGGSLWIHSNIALTSLTGLDNIDAGSINNLRIVYNNILSTCEVQSICDFLLSPNGTIEIHDNAVGCNSQTEVEAACTAGLDDSNTSENQFHIYPNPSSIFITIETSAIPTRSHLTIINLNGQVIIKCQISEPKTVIDITSLPNGVYFLRLINDRTVETEKLVKW